MPSSLLICAFLLSLGQSATSPAVVPAGGGAARAHPEAYLAQLHLHGSLSEGTASMAHHVAEAERIGYDVLWWTDHMERQFDSLYTHHLGFEGSLTEIQQFYMFNQLVVEQGRPGFLTIGFGSAGPAAGTKYGTVHLQAGGGDWEEGRLVYGSSGMMERKFLPADPEIRLQVRPEHFTGDAGMLIRVRLSSRGDGASELGTPNLIEYVPAGQMVPPPSGGELRVALPALSNHQWNALSMRPLSDAAAFAEGDDQSLYQVSIVFAGRGGASAKVDLDEFSLDLLGLTDLALLQRQEAVLAARYSANLIHYVGMEVAGPAFQETQEFGTRDHLTALFPGGITRLYDFTDPMFKPQNYPGSGVTAIHQDGGVAVLCHVFGVRWPLETLIPETAFQLGRRVLKARAWQADALEVGYPHRERPLRDHVRVWDALSEDSVFITGVGVSDNHYVEGWDKRLLRWGSWIHAPSPAARDLADGVLAGKLFFGDPQRFDPQGNLIFEARDGSFSMGNVVPLEKGQQGFHVYVDGAQAGDELVVVKNGAEAQRLVFAAAELDAEFTLQVGPGEWVRLELHDGAGQPYLYSNPIYFVPLSFPLPPYRQPGSP